MRGHTQSRFVAQFAHPMVSADFAYSTRGALVAIGLAFTMVSLLYAFTN